MLMGHIKVTDRGQRVHKVSWTYNRCRPTYCQARSIGATVIRIVSSLTHISNVGSNKISKISDFVDLYQVLFSKALQTCRPNVYSFRNKQVVLFGKYLHA